MDEVEFLAVDPGVFGVVDDEFDVWWDTGLISGFGRDVGWEGYSHRSGWLGLRSMPVT